MPININLIINSITRECLVEPNDTLLTTLRSLGYVGTKSGCDDGTCGACSVLIDGRLMSSCMVLTISAQNKSILTIEGVTSQSNLHFIQRAFIEAGAVQCGYCTPGMIMAALSLLNKTTQPAEEDIIDAIGGNICRCTGYIKIIKAIKNAAAYLRNIGAECFEKHKEQ